MKIEFMSSEESEVDGDEDVLSVHNLPWRKAAVKKMFDTLDAEIAKTKTPQSRRQLKRRIDGSSSTRSQPSSAPKWATA